MTTLVQERAELERVIGFKDYVAIGFGVVIGVGWVVYAGQWLIGGGVLGAVLAFLLGGAMLIPVGRCYAEMTAALPVTGGEVAFTYKAFGPFPAFLTAWALSLMYIAVVPFETIAVGAMTEAIFPAFATEPLYAVNGFAISWSTIVPGVLSGFWIIWLNWRSASDMARFQTIVTITLLACAAVFCLAAFLNGELGNLRPLFSVHGDWWVAAPASIAAVIVVVPFFLAGFDTIPQAAEEAGMNVRPRQLGTAIVTTIIIGTLFYVVIILALASSTPQQDLASVVEQKNVLPMAHVFTVSLGFEWAAQIVLIAAMLGILSTLNGIFMAATRLLFALGRGGLLPQWFGVLHPVHRTPSNAIRFVGLIALLGPFVGKAALVVIVNAGSLVFAVTLLVTSLVTFRLRIIAPDLRRPYRASRFNIVLAILVGFALVGLMVVPASPGQLGGAEFTLVGVWILLGIVLYWVRQRHGLMHRSEQALQILGPYA